MRVPDELVDKSVDELELSVRSSNCLKSYGILTVGQMVKFFTSRSRSAALKEIKHFGVKSYYEVMSVIDTWREPEPERQKPESLYDYVEPLARRVRLDNINTVLLYSIAVSAKRIADRVCSDE